MTISAHIQSRTTGANNKHVGNREEIFFNRQELNNQLGAASIRVYTFNLASKQVNVSTFALDLKKWLADSKNQFSFSINLQQNAVPEIATAAILILFVILIFSLLFVLRRKRKSF